MLLFIINCCMQILMYQEIEITIDKQQTVNDTICFKISNSTNQDIWFYTPGLTSKITIRKANGEILSPITKLEANPLNVPRFVLIEAFSIKDIFLPIGDLLSQYKFSIDKEYYMILEYENYIRKTKSKIKTYTGKNEIKPISIRNSLIIGI